MSVVATVTHLSCCWALGALLMVERHCTHWRHLANTIELGLPLADPSPQPKWQVDRLSHFCRADGRKSCILYNGRPFSQNCRFSYGICTPSNLWFIGAIRTHNPNGISIGWAVFCTADCRVSLYFTMGRPLSPRMAPSHGGSGPPSNTWFPGPTQILNPNDISISTALFAGLTSVTDRPTDRQTNRPCYSVSNSRPASPCVVLPCKPSNNVL